jgi:hypothetical protein
MQVSETFTSSLQRALWLTPNPYKPSERSTLASDLNSLLAQPSAVHDRVAALVLFDISIGVLEPRRGLLQRLQLSYDQLVLSGVRLPWVFGLNLAAQAAQLNFAKRSREAAKAAYYAYVLLARSEASPADVLQPLEVLRLLSNETWVPAHRVNWINGIAEPYLERCERDAKIRRYAKDWREMFRERSPAQSLELRCEEIASSPEVDEDILAERKYFAALMRSGRLSHGEGDSTP